MRDNVILILAEDVQNPELVSGNSPNSQALKQNIKLFLSSMKWPLVLVEQAKCLLVIMKMFVPT